MKAGELSMVQYCAEHGSFRVLPLATCRDLACNDMERGVAHGWVVVAYAADEGDAFSRMKEFKRVLKEKRNG